MSVRLSQYLTQVLEIESSRRCADTRKREKTTEIKSPRGALKRYSKARKVPLKLKMCKISFLCSSKIHFMSHLYNIFWSIRRCMVRPVTNCLGFLRNQQRFPAIGNRSDLSDKLLRFCFFISRLVKFKVTFDSLKNNIAMLLQRSFLQQIEYFTWTIWPGRVYLFIFVDLTFIRIMLLNDFIITIT